MKLNSGDFYYLGFCLEGFFFGVYSGIFAMYLQYYESQQSTDKAKNILSYALWVLYALSAATVIIDTAVFHWADAIGILHHLQIIQATVFACCDFIAQFILIYRCWIIWGYSIRVVIVPSFLAFSFLVIWIAEGTASLFITQGRLYNITDWGVNLQVTGLALSMTVNGLVTSLIVFRIFKVFQEFKTTSTTNNRTLGVTGGSTLRRVIFIVIESGMALFSIQMTRLVATIMNTSDAVVDAFDIIAFAHQMLNGITPTIILVRVSMGLSFHDESSMVEATSLIGSLRFAYDDPDSIPEAGNIDILDEKRDDDIEKLSDDSNIQMVDR